MIFCKPVAGELSILKSFPFHPFFFVLFSSFLSSLRMEPRRTRLAPTGSKQWRDKLLVPICTNWPRIPAAISLGIITNRPGILPGSFNVVPLSCLNSAPQVSRCFVATMSSQGNEAIPVVHAPDGVGYKLIELPAELLALLESDNPPV